MLSKIALGAALAIGVMTTSAFAADAATRFEIKRIPGGPRADQYVPVRVAETQRPYALSGDREAKPVRYELKRVPGGPRADHYVLMPVWR